MIPDTLTKAAPQSIYDVSRRTTLAGEGFVNGSFAEFLIAEGLTPLAAYEAIRLYSQCLPYFRAVDLRASGVSSLKLKIWDKKSESFLTQEHEVLELLNKPNADIDQTEFLYAYSSFIDITGNSYLSTNGFPGRPPLEIHTVNPVQVSATPSTQDGTAGYAGRYEDSDPFAGNAVYNLDDKSGRFRYIRSDGDGEFWHVRHFNPLRNGNHLYGQSPAQPIWLEIQQYIEGNSTNYHGLKQGIRPSGVFVNTMGKPLTETQWSRLQEAAAKYSGAKGTGKAFAADGVDFKPAQITNREMEYRGLQQDMLERISYRYGIPLVILTNAAATYNNLATGRYMLYDGSILPHANKLFSDMTNFLMPFYKNSEDFVITYDRSEIDELRLRAFEEAKTMKDIEVFSDNEIRTTTGYEERDGGDEIYKRNNLVVIGQDTDTRGNDNDPPTNAGKFVELLLQTKKADGTFYTEIEAYKIAQQEGLMSAEQ